MRNRFVVTFGGKTLSENARAIHYFSVDKQKWKRTSTRLSFDVKSECSCIVGSKIYFLKAERFVAADVDSLVRALKLEVEFISSSEVQIILSKWWRDSKMTNVDWMHGLDDEILRFMNTTWNVNDA